MPMKFFAFAAAIFFLSGCATAGKNHALELQQCQSQIASLQEELKEKDREVAQLERKLQKKEDESYRKSAIPARIKNESNYSTPSAPQIQKALKNAGYYNGPIDGKTGAKTQNAIIKFQKNNGLKADGEVGQKTWNELKRYL